jgi:hypothetical protein
MTMALLKSGVSIVLHDGGREALERQTKFVFSTTLSLLTALRRRCKKRGRVSGADAKVLLLGLKWASVGFMIGMGHRFCVGLTDGIDHRDVIIFIRRSLVMFKEIVGSVRFAIGAISLPVIFEKNVSAVIFRFLYEMRINKTLSRLMSQAEDEVDRDDVMRMIHAVDALEVAIEQTHDRTVEVDDTVLAFAIGGVGTRKQSVRKKAAVH